MKILITGASGFLGKEILKIIPNKYEIISWYNNNLPVQHAMWQQVNLGNLEQVKNQLSSTKPNAIIHLAAVANISYCEEHEVESNKINVVATKTLVEYALDKNIPFVFASTDQVFDGKKGNYVETDLPKPLHNYGVQKFEAEQIIVEKYPKAVIIRLPLLIGESGGYAKNFIENLKQNKSQKLFDDEIRSPLDVKDAATGLITALNFEGGIYHFGGNNILNRYELGLAISKKYNLQTKLLQKSKQRDVIFNAPRPANVSMVNTKAVNAGFKINHNLI